LVRKDQPVADGELRATVRRDELAHETRDVTVGLQRPCDGPHGVAGLHDVRRARHDDLAAVDVGGGGAVLWDEGRIVPEHRITDISLTARQREILEVIERNMREHGYPPSVREIGEAVGLTSPSTVHNHLNTLQRLGYLRRDPTKPRALEVRYESSSGAAMER